MAVEEDPVEANATEPVGFGRWILLQLDAVLLVVVCGAHILLAPYTKVEESFNVQAVYDLLHRDWGSPGTFDHATFPGVVPRTFLGPLALHALVRPVQRALELTPHGTLLAVRGALACLTVLSLLAVRRALRMRHSDLPFVGTLFTLLTAAQFHIPFYAGRPLPNVFALVLTNLSLALRTASVETRYTLAAHSVMAFAVAVFRSELSILLFFTVAYDAYCGLSNFFVSAVTCVLAAFGGALASIVVDTHFWGPPTLENALPGALGRTLLRYPELEVFYYNAILGKSSAWGTSVWHWYFSTALPRALIGAGPLAWIGIMSSRGRARRVCLRAALPALAFVGVYSALPHKELRFIFYVLPALTLCAAHGGAALLSSKTTRSERFSGSLAILLCIGLSAAVTVLSTAASYHNYPGADAIQALTAIGSGDRAERQCSALRVHVDAHAAGRGVSQFVEAAARGDCAWEMSRAENLDSKDYAAFTHLVSRNATVDGFRVVHVAHAYSGLDFRSLRIRTAPDVYVHERLRDEL